MCVSLGMYIGRHPLNRPLAAKLMRHRLKCISGFDNSAAYACFRVNFRVYVFGLDLVFCSIANAVYVPFHRAASEF